MGADMVSVLLLMMTYTYWYIQGYLSKCGLLWVGKVKKDAKINHRTST